MSETAPEIRELQDARAGVVLAQQRYEIAKIRYSQYLARLVSDMRAMAYELEVMASYQGQIALRDAIDSGDDDAAAKITRAICVASKARLSTEHTIEDAQKEHYAQLQA